MTDASCSPPPFKRGKILPTDLLVESPLHTRHGVSSSNQLKQRLLPTTSSATCSSDCRPRRENDCLTCLPTDVLCRITCYLPAYDLLQLRLVHAATFKDLCVTNEAGWENLCLTLWSQKAHVCRAARERLATNACQAYQIAIEDATTRHYITKEELCSVVWSFRFKDAAGTDWTAVDPWHNGLPSRKLAFLPDGSVKRVVTEGDSSKFYPPDFGRSNNVVIDNVLQDPMYSMTWRFLQRPMDLPARPWGSYVRFSLGGRDVPTYAVRRSPTGNWGFVLESCWGLYASFELPPKRFKNNNLATGSNNPHRHLRRRSVTTGSSALDQNELVWVQSDNENDDEVVVQPLDPLQDDSSLQITNEIQWREAFLYNVGARVLPEGDEARTEFDRAWGGL